MPGKETLTVRPRAFIVAALLLTAPAIAQADEAQPSCPNNGSMTAMMVPNKYIAESIYRAVGGALAPGNFRKFPQVIVEDKGDHWSVAQTVAAPVFGTDPSDKPKADAAPVTTGKGQLHMDIDKCTAAISHAALNR